jgi:capsular exopolysaccharide synthesis family protein
VETANNQQVLQVRERELTNVEANLNQRFLEFPLIVREYNDIQQKLEIATKTLNQFLTQRETLRVEAAQKEVPWELVADAQVARVESKPTKKLLMGLGLGLGLGLLLAFLKETLQNRFLSSEDIASITKLPALSVVPRRRGLMGLDPAVSNGARDSFSQAFTSLYTNIRFLPMNPAVRSLVISSAVTGDGKTTVAAHLAMAAAAMGQKVLLVDANLRSPSLHNLFELPNQKGLSEILSNTDLAWADLVQPTSLDENLSVLPAGQSVRNTGRLLASQEAKVLVKQLEQAYDLVVFDTPSMIDVSDASFLAAETSGVLLVVSINRVKRSAVTQVVKEMEKFRLKVLGVVPNHVGRGYEQQPIKPLAEIGSAEEPAMLTNLNIFSPSTAPVDKQSRDVVR